VQGVSPVEIRGQLASHGGELIEPRKVTPVIDKIYPLRQTAEAIAYLEAGRAAGKIVITV
jgi:NADPH:quinone reductase-like Zn-dependent oxidoreductase